MSFTPPCIKQKVTQESPIGRALAPQIRELHGMVLPFSCRLDTHASLYRILKISEMPSNAMPTARKAKLKYCFLVNRSFKMTRANIMVTRQ